MKLRQDTPAFVRVLVPIRNAVVALGLALLAYHWMTAGLDEVTTPVERPPAEGSPSTVFDRHADDCWTGEAPADVDYPGAVIWQHPDGRTVYSTRLVDQALDTLFADGDLPGRPIAFCR